MRMEDLNWMDIETYLKNDDRLILIIGATEQHGYLSLVTDVRIPQALADSAAQQTSILVAPPLNFGSSPYFLDYPGTLSLRITTLLDAIEDLVRSAYGQGFRRILLLNGHVGNDGARARLAELASQMIDLHLAWYSWWTAHSVLNIAEKHQIKPAHANWLEAFPFTIVSDLPSEDKIPPSVPGILGAKRSRLVLGDGSFGGKYQVDSNIMQEIFDAALQDILTLLEFDG
ncbi:MAG: creatininase family protein [Chloroflexota bacterium]